MSARGVLRLGGLVALLALAACGQSLFSYRSPTIGDATTQEEVNRPTVGGIANAVRGFFRPTPPISRPQQVISADVLQQSPVPLLLLEFEDNNTWTLLQPSLANGAVQTWISDTGQTLSFDDQGVLQATRGLGRDLMIADSKELRSHMARRAGASDNLLRVVELLDGENQIIRDAFVCTLRDVGVAPRPLFAGTEPLREIQEACFGAQGEAFTNLYWRDPRSGFLRGSLQWISPEVGRARFEVITN